MLLRQGQADEDNGSPPQLVLYLPVGLILTPAGWSRFSRSCVSKEPLSSLPVPLLPVARGESITPGVIKVGEERELIQVRLIHVS